MKIFDPNWLMICAHIYDHTDIKKQKFWHGKFFSYQCEYERLH